MANLKGLFSLIAARRCCAGLSAFLAALVLGHAAPALAAQPEPWAMGFQPAVSPTAIEIEKMNAWLLPLIVIIAAFVLVLLIYVMWRFSEKRNPTPSKTTHNTTIEVIWTVAPVIILALMIVPSFKLLYLADQIEDADMTIKAIGRQWYWSYEYPDHDGLTFDANIDEEQEPRLLVTDNALVLPVNTRIRVLITASDVLHNFAMPSMGLKLDAVPGRVNETWVEILEEGTYYGQCSELCGTGHAYMPIMIKAVSKSDFDVWVEQAKVEFARNDGPAQTPDGETPDTETAESETPVRLAAGEKDD